jgi:hypothetical protein
VSPATWADHGRRLHAAVMLTALGERVDDELNVSLSSVVPRPNDGPTSPSQPEPWDDTVPVPTMRTRRKVACRAPSDVNASSGPVTIGRLSAVVPYMKNQERCRIKYRSALSEDIWRAYESTQKHYDSDFNLFTNRMNLFLAVESVLITIATAAVVWQNATVPIRIQLAISAFGVLLSLAWLAAAISTYQ